MASVDRSKYMRKYRRLHAAELLRYRQGRSKLKSEQRRRRSAGKFGRFICFAGNYYVIINHVNEKYWRVQAKILGTRKQFQGVGTTLRGAVENARLDWGEVEAVSRVSSVDNFSQRS